jgi:hypothetical protein
MNSTLIRFSGYAAATVIFLSWFINNTFVASLQDDTQALDAIRSEQADAANLSQMDDLAEGQRELLKKITILQNGRSEDQENLAWVESLESSSARLASSAQELEDLVNRVKPEDQEELVQAIKTSVVATETFSTEIHSQADTYKQGNTAESLDALEATDQGFDELSDTVVAHYEKMDTYMTEKRERSASAANTASIIAYLFSALGLALGGAGKWLEKKQSKSSTSVTA